MNTITIKISRCKPIKLNIHYETVQALARLLKKKVSNIEYVLDCQSPKNPEELTRRAIEYKIIYDQLIQIPKPKEKKGKTSSNEKEKVFVLQKAL